MATNHCSRPRIRGFSLVEMAVVLAIIGLLVGGVLAGQSLLKGQRLRAVLTDATTYATAVNQFKLKYGDLPGDFPDATKVWGRADGGADVTQNCSPVNTASTGAPSCNGDGNGQIQNNNASGVGESLRFWQHLSAAGFITGNFTGIAATGGNIHTSVAGVNVPGGAIQNTAYFIFSWGLVSGATFFFDGDYTNTMTYGGIRVGDWPNGPAIRPDEAFNLDVKADDGKPAYGSIRAPQAQWQANCATSNASNTALYNISFQDSACLLLFLNTFMQSKEQLR